MKNLSITTASKNYSVLVGNDLFSTKNFEEFNKGAKIKLSGVVKAHSTTNYYGNETVLTRCNLMRDI